MRDSLLLRLLLDRYGPRRSFVRCSDPLCASCGAPTTPRLAHKLRAASPRLRRPRPPLRKAPLTGARRARAATAPAPQTAPSGPGHPLGSQCARAVRCSGVRREWSRDENHLRHRGAPRLAESHRRPFITRSPQRPSAHPPPAAPTVLLPRGLSIDLSHEVWWQWGERRFLVLRSVN